MDGESAMRLQSAVLAAVIAMTGCVNSPPPNAPWRYDFFAPIAESQCERYGVSRNTLAWADCVRRGHQLQ